MSFQASWAGAAGTPPKEAFHVETIVDSFTQEDVIGMVRHPGVPYVVRGTDSALTFDAQCRHIGLAYLDALWEVLRQEPAAVLDPQWIRDDIREALTKPRDPSGRCFGWLPVTWPGAGAGRRPLGSFMADRVDENGVRAGPSLLVLLAGSVDTEYQLQFGSDMGLRIVLHLHDGEVRIHGVTLAGLSSRRALEVIPAQPGDIFGLVDSVRAVVGKALDCEEQVWINNLENVCQPDTPPGHLIAVGYALRWPKATEKDPERAAVRARTYDFRVELAVETGNKVRLVRVHRDVYIGAGATATLNCFVQDAASNDRPSSGQSDDPSDLPNTLAGRRSTLSDEALRKFRDPVSAELVGGHTLKYSDTGVEFFETRAASERSTRRLGGRTVAANRRGVVTVAAADAEGYDALSPPARSDEQASVDAHLRAAEFFGRMLAYGLRPPAYFRFARLPLVHRARPAMRWAPDGELPIAEVRPFNDAPAAGKTARQRPSDTLQLLVNYGSADPVHRHKLRLVKDTRFKAQYLSVASDPRWAWHEFGHVLNFASTGELEFPFAHSAGDALAAIASDPISHLASWEKPDAEIRHATYPWIEVPGRSHGRSAMGGYGWCGCRNLVRLDFSASLDRYHHTYFGEQIMSSSLFRLYRSLGGDTRAAGGRREDEDERVRLSASDYCIYLIMRGISLLGPDTLAPARTPDQFVSALIEADLGTDAWAFEATWPYNRGSRDVQRKGGRVHKVIRWAFEQQGLYATDNPRVMTEKQGLAPRVDVYIADRRRRDEGLPGDGGYAPVPLRLGDDQPWHAHGDWLRRSGGQLTVQVANRGSQTASDTRVRVWWLSAVGAAGQLAWDAIDVPDSAQPIPAGEGGVTAFQVPLPPEAEALTALWVLVSADAPADPSNLASGVSPPKSRGDLLELVAHDNNLALARL
ncbi:hypothetical protein [Roseateles sp. P5_E7]